MRRPAYVTVRLAVESVFGLAWNTLLAQRGPQGLAGGAARGLCRRCWQLHSATTVRLAEVGGMDLLSNAERPERRRRALLIRHSRQR